MDPVVVAYALYLLVSIPLTVAVARTLSKHGRTFLTGAGAGAGSRRPGIPA